MTSVFSTLLCIFLAMSSWGFSSAHESAPGILLAYPKSASTWIRYSLEYCSNRPTYCITDKLPDLRNPANRPLSDFFDLGADHSKPGIIKSHSRKHIKTQLGEDTGNHLLLFIVRNPLDFLRRNTRRNTMPLMSKEKMKENIKSDGSMSFPYPYFDLFEIYNSWPEEQKLLVYYEDFMNDPESQLYRMCEFFGEKTDRIPEFIQNIKFHGENCANFYQHTVQNLDTIKIKDKLNYFVSQYTKEEIEEIHQTIKNLQPNSYEILKRYFILDTQEHLK
jgi:hypothetical protein